MAPVSSASSENLTTSSLALKKQNLAADPAPAEDIPAPASSARPTAAHAVPARPSFAFDRMEDALAAFARGEFLVVMDDEGRENEGDLILAASECSTEKMAWLIRHASGYVCCALPGARLDALAIPMMVAENQDPHRTAYTVTVDYRHGTTTGISAHDRALTARALASSATRASSFSRPGHMVPLRVRAGGVLARRGHTEAAVDLCALAGLPRAGVLCELVEDDEAGSMMRRDGCRAFADRWGLKMISVEMLARWRAEREADGVQNGTRE